MGIFADALAAAMNPSCAGGNHAAIYVEHQVTGWFREMLGFPAGVGGAARQRRIDGDDDGARRGTARQERRRRPRRTACATRRRRSPSTCRPRRTAARARRSNCWDSAAPRSGRSPTGADYRMNVDALEAAHRRTTARTACGRSRSSPPAARPTPARSTTSTRSPASAAVTTCGCTWTRRTAGRRSSRPSTAARCARSRRPTASRSIRTSGCSCRSKPASSLVRDAEAMRSAFSLVPPYIRQSGSAGEVYGLPWFSEFGFQQTRGFRALKVWMTLQQFGLNGIQGGDRGEHRARRVSRRPRPRRRRTSS